MNDGHRVYIVGIGLATPAGLGVDRAVEALRAGERRLGPPTLFAVPAVDPATGLAPPVAEVAGFEPDGAAPRTHALALVAAEEALRRAGASGPPDAVVLGGTTGGMPATEVLVRDAVADPASYRWHGAGTPAEHVARQVGCTGPALTVATACSSGAVALEVALELLRQGRARTVLAGGVDALCRLTYHGFNMLKVIDPRGARPLDAERAGMTVGEGAAMLLLQAAPAPPARAVAELVGGGLSCDAYHPSSPHPEGLGALAAMRAALDDAGLKPGDVGYVHLHGTGTTDNDAAEARGLRALFGASPLPPHSSIKGAFGHAVGAAGAIGAAVSALAIERGFVPGNVGCSRLDPALDLAPALSSTPAPGLEVAMANAFGFGGNNAVLVVAAPTRARRPPAAARGADRLAVLAASAVTGAGFGPASLARLLDEAGGSAAGAIGEAELAAALPASAKSRLRRVKRLTRLAMALAAQLGEGGAPPPGIDAVVLGTCWGTLSETHDFLARLFESGERFSSPTDFVGTVHNSVAGHLAMWLGARGANVTVTTGASSFEDALGLAALLAPRAGEVARLVVGVDEAHPVLTPRFDPGAVIAGAPLADGGGALLLAAAGADDARVTVRPAPRLGAGAPRAVEAAIEALGGAARLRDELGAVWYGVAGDAPGQLEALLAALDPGVATIDYRARLGAYPTAAAAATALAALALADPATRARPVAGGGRSILVVGLGEKVTAVEVSPGARGQRPKVV